MLRMRSDGALLSSAFSLLRCAYDAAGREAYSAIH